MALPDPLGLFKVGQHQLQDWNATVDQMKEQIKNADRNVTKLVSLTGYRQPQYGQLLKLQGDIYRIQNEIGNLTSPILS